MGLLSDGTTWLATQLADSAGQTVSIRRGQRQAAGITAVQTADDQLAKSIGPVQTDCETTTWLIDKTAYAFGGTASEPQPGDEITTTGETWEVMPIDAAGHVSVWGSGEAWSINCKRVA